MDRLCPMKMARVNYRFDYPFPLSEAVEFFRENYWPMTRAFASLDDSEQGQLRADLVADASYEQ